MAGFLVTWKRRVQFLYSSDNCKTKKYNNKEITTVKKLQFKLLLQATNHDSKSNDRWVDLREGLDTNKIIPYARQS